MADTNESSPPATQPKQQVIDSTNGILRIRIDANTTVKVDDTEDIRQLLATRSMTIHDGHVAINLPPLLNPSGKKGLVNMHTYIMRDCLADTKYRIVHVDRDPLNLTRDNLRVLDYRQHAQLVRCLGEESDNTLSGIKGIQRTKQAQIGWLVRWKDINGNQHKMAFKDEDYGGKANVAMSVAKAFIMQKDQENREQIMHHVSVPPKQSTLPQYPVDASSDESVGCSINEIISRGDGILKILLSQNETMLTDDLPQIWKILKYYRFYAHANHRTMYAETNTMINRKWHTVKFHQLLAPFIPGNGDQIDHINGNGLDNRLANLRKVPQCINKRNSHAAYKNSKTGITGLHQVRKFRGYNISWTDDAGKTRWKCGFNESKYGSMEAAKAAAVQELKNIRSSIGRYRRSGDLLPGEEEDIQEHQQQHNTEEENASCCSGDDDDSCSSYSSSSSSPPSSPPPAKRPRYDA